MNKQITIFIILLIAAPSLSFYGGMKYNQTQFVAERGAIRAQFGTNAGAGRAGGSFRGGAGGGAVFGEVLARDDKSITVKLRDGGSKIVFLSGTTEIMQSSQGSAQDIIVGAQVIVNGTANSDGSITGQSVQIQPKLLQSNQ